MTPSLSLPRKRYEEEKAKYSIQYVTNQTCKDGLVVNICISTLTLPPVMILNELSGTR